MDNDQMETVLEAEYRTWRVAVIRLERGIDEMERNMRQSHSSSPPASSSKSHNISRRLADVRDQHQRIENKLDRIRLQIDAMRTRLDRMAC